MHKSIRFILGMGLAGTVLAGTALAQSQPAAGAQNQPAGQQGSSSSTDTPPPKKVYTNDDLHALRRSDDVSVVGKSNQTARPGQTTASGPKNEQYWRNRAQKLRSEIADVDRQIAELAAANQRQGSATNGTNTTAAPTGAYYGNSRAGMQYQNQMRRLQNRKAQLEEQMDQLEEEARRANVPAGWLR